MWFRSSLYFLSILAVISFAPIPKIAAATLNLAAEPIQIFATTQQDLDGDGAPDVTVIECAFATEHDQVLVHDINGDMPWGTHWQDVTDFSDDMSERDKLLKPGEEAQWCIFDPILSVIHGQRYLKDGDESQYDLQIEHFRRSLAQLTSAESRFPAFRCPESYFLEHGEWIPNDITPLLWTQGNLLLAFHRMKEVSLRRSDRFRAGQ